jgi:hypothetical protein
MIMEKSVEWLAGETEVLWENLPPVPLCPPQNPHAARTRTLAAAVGSQRLTAELRHGHKKEKKVHDLDLAATVIGRFILTVMK